MLLEIVLNKKNFCVKPYEPSAKASLATSQLR